jgi:hypothetical protein
MFGEHGDQQTRTGRVKRSRPVFYPMAEELRRSSPITTRYETEAECEAAVGVRTR